MTPKERAIDLLGLLGELLPDGYYIHPEDSATTLIEQAITAAIKEDRARIEKEINELCGRYKLDAFDGLCHTKDGYLLYYDAVMKVVRGDS